MTLRSGVSPRSQAAPMAFTGLEFARGAIAAWVWFLILSTVALLPMLTFVVWVAVLMMTPWSIGALVLGSPIAYGLGRSLRHVDSIRVHVVAFLIFGVVIGVSTTALALVVPGTGFSEPGIGGYLLPSIAVCGAASVAVPLGWWHTARRALRRDRGELTTERSTTCA